METCYMCNELRTSDEHVPPKCIFPEIKDSPDSKDYRKNLITVPSCDVHNSKKSKEDEFFLMYIASIASNNEAASLQRKTKLTRILDYKPYVWNELLKNSKPAFIIDKNGVEHQTCTFSIDPTRVNTQLNHIAKALHFHHFKEKWLENIVITLLSGLETDNKEVNKANRKTALLSSDIFIGKEKHGNNPDVFFYQVEKSEKHKLVHAVFFENIKILFLYN